MPVDFQGQRSISQSTTMKITIRVVKTTVQRSRYTYMKITFTQNLSVHLHPTWYNADMEIALPMMKPIDIQGHWSRSK